MKQILLLVFVVSASVGYGGEMKGHEHFITNEPTQGVIYTCPMHPEIQASKPGKCPKCGMTLVVDKTKPVKKPVPKKPTTTPVKKNVPATSSTWTCPMHPEIHATKPGNCPKCGMTLVKEKAKTSTPPAVKPVIKNQDTIPQQPVNGKASIWTCTMHPEVHADKPGNCPKCGMKLVLDTDHNHGNPEKPGEIKSMQDSVAVLPPGKTEVTWTCPMHPEIQADKPGNCPKCGMKLVKEKTKAPANMAMVYACPMHPEVQSDRPGVCPKCGMKLVLQKTNGDASSEKINQAKLNLGPIKTIVNNTPPRTVRYDIYLKDTIVNFSGKPKRAIAANGQIPMPTLTFTTGDTAEIYVHNLLKEETSVHWHGLFLPNRFDGVPNLTQMPIKPGETYLYKYPIIQDGTHWYHSHTHLQEQIGMYGAFIMNKREEWDIPTVPIVISDWTDMKPEEVNRSLHNATDWFAIRKGSTQSYTEAIRGGHLKTKITNEWKRMNAMDVSDVYYEKFLVNGENQHHQPQFKGGDKVRLRIANAGASSYFWLTYAGGKITVVATDGNDVEPVEVDRLIIAVSETYDVVVTIPADSTAYEFLVTPEDRTKSASLWLGTGIKQLASPLPKLKYFAGMKMMNDMMAMNGDLKTMGMKMSNQVMDMNEVMYPEITGPENAKDTTKGMGVMNMDHSGHDMANMNATDESGIVTLNYGMLADTKETTLPSWPLKVLEFDLTGNMNRYVWTLDNKTVSESDRILIKKGENVRIILFNNSMMRHPMHLHGHDFRLLNGKGANAPMKNIIDIMPMERDTIEFAASESGDWFFHCHILYHMMSGMGKVFRYENSPPNPDIPNPKLAQRMLFKDDRMFHSMAEIGLESNGSDGRAMMGNTRYEISTLWHLGLHDKHGYESETMVGRYLGKMQWIFPYVGFDYHFKREGGPKNFFSNEDKNMFGQLSGKNNRKTVVAGIAYTLPMMVIGDFRVDGKGKFRFQLSREDIPVAPRVRFNWMLNTDKEYAAGLRYIVTKYLSISSHYDSDMGPGAGITITY